MKNILYTLLFKILRGALAGLLGHAVTMGIITSGQKQYVLEGVAAGVMWGGSALMSSVLHNLRLKLALNADPDRDFTLAEIRAATRSAIVDTIKSLVRKFLNSRKDVSNESNQ